MPTATPRDPRTIITPDAFEVSADLVGMPLALPRTRAMALLIDGIVITLITMLTKSFSLILGVVAAALFVGAAFKRTEVRGSVFGRAMRFSVGCLGVFIAVITASLWAVFGANFGGDAESTALGPAFDMVSVSEQIAQGMADAGIFDDLEVADSRGEALDLAVGLVDAGEGIGLSRRSMRTTLLALAPDSAAWSDGWTRVVDSLVAYGEGRPDVSVDASVLTEEIAAYTDQEALRIYSGLSGDEDEDARLRRSLLEVRLIPLVAGDTMAALEERVIRLERELISGEQALSRSNSRLDDLKNRGIRARIMELADDLGFGFGWAAVYLTVFLSWWNGQTVGKRLMRIRVVRLDGNPITWWVAFERTGGYAAGLFTGLLGFAQVWWDGNRQAIHDRIVGTVVVTDGAKKIENWEAEL
ncbi:MAG: RDD family protein [Longimicrobiales bacterium]